MPVVEGLTWTLPAALGVTVVAAQLEHRVPCWGYVLQEHDPPGRPDPARLAEMRVSAVRHLRPHSHMTACWRMLIPVITHTVGWLWLYAYWEADCQKATPDRDSVEFTVRNAGCCMSVQAEGQGAGP